MIHIPVTIEDIDFAKNQIAAFEQSDYGTWRYRDVEAWRGVVCEMLASRWLTSQFGAEVQAKGIDTSGNCDLFDVLIKGKKIEIKSATKNYFRYIMPKIHDIDTLPKDIYIGVKYNEEVEPNRIAIIGYMLHAEIPGYPKKQNKGAPYYEIPIADLHPIEELTFD